MDRRDRRECAGPDLPTGVSVIDAGPGLRTGRIVRHTPVFGAPLVPREAPVGRDPGPAHAKRVGRFSPSIPPNAQVLAGPMRDALAKKRCADLVLALALAAHHLAHPATRSSAWAMLVPARTTGRPGLRWQLQSGLPHTERRRRRSLRGMASPTAPSSWCYEAKDKENAGPTPRTGETLADTPVLGRCRTG